MSAVFRSMILALALGALAIAPAAEAAPVAKKKTRGHIVNGNFAQFTAPFNGAIPYQVGLVPVKNGQISKPYDVFCGGTIARSTMQHIVTAAHCVPDSNAADIAVVGNLLNRYDTPGFGPQERRVTAITSHPQFVSVEQGFDVAVLTLDAPLTAPAQWVNLGTTTPAAVGTSSWISGWGATQSGAQGSQQLLVATIRVMSATSCQAYGEDFRDTMLCAGEPLSAENAIDSCQGDSGGPLVSQTSPPRLIGVVSWGKGCGQTQFPGIYARISHPELNALASSTNLVPRAEPITGASVQGTPAAGQTLTCDPGQWNNHTGNFIFTWISAVKGADGKFTDVKGEPSGQTLALSAAHVGRVVGCAATSVGPGGARQSGAPLVTVGPPIAAAAPPAAPPVQIRGDLIAPTSRFTRRSCDRKSRTCSLTITATDSGGPATKAAVTYARISGCKKGKKGAKCRKAKTLKVKSRGKGVFTVTTPRLAPAKYRFTVIATDASGNRSKQTSVVLTVKRR
ncbi:MAG: serine protease [Solirubrobacteraceae bacterium]|nr:serine protease [Solirubrobacteraceae bacterium]